MPLSATHASIDALPCGFVQLDAADRVVLWNQQFEHWTGLARAVVTGRSFAELFPGDPGLSALLAEIRAQGRPRVLAQMFHGRLFRVPLPPGHLSGLAEMQQECHVVPLVEPAGHLALTVLDVTPRVVGQRRLQSLLAERTAARDRAERSLRDLAQREIELQARDRELSTISENIPESALYQYVTTLTGPGRLTYLGRGAHRIFGELPRRLPADVNWFTSRMHPDDVAGITAAGARSRETLEPFYHEVRIRAADGVERWVSFRSRPRLGPDGSIIFDGVIVDVTERRRAEAEARRQAQFLAALNQTTLEMLGRRNVTDLLQALVDRACTLLNSPHTEISLLEGDDLVVRAFNLGGDFLVGDRVPRSVNAVSWQAVDTGRPVVVSDYASHPSGRPLYRERGVRVAAVFPILRGTECVGVLGVARDHSDQAYSVEEITEGVLLARMAALVLHNAAVHEEAVREAELRTAALRESEARFRGLFDRSPLIIALLELPEGRIVELNAAALAAFGYSREEAIGRTTGEVNLWADADLRDRYLDQLAHSGVVTGFEAQMRRKDGTTFTVLHNGCIISFGGKRYNIASVQDITPRKQSEAARDRTLALMRATLDSTADGILVVNAEGRIENFNANFFEMWRLPPFAVDDPEGENLFLRTILGQLVDPAGFLASLRDLYSGSEDEVFDLIHCKDGRIFERFSRPQLLQGRPAGRVWSFRDITERRRAEAALRESEERFRVLAEVSPVGIFRTDPAGRTTFVNRRWCEIAGLSPAQALGDGWQAALHPEDRTRILAGWEQVVRDGRDGSSAEFRFIRPDGTVTWLVGQSRALFRADGTRDGFVGTITDVTNLKRAEEERLKVEAQLRQVHKMESLGTLAGGIAHDFNNILTGTFGFIDLARLELPDHHPARAWLDRIGASSQRARDLVRQILTFSRKTEGRRSPQRIHVVVAEALRLLRTTLPPFVTLDTRISPDTPAILADPTQIHQVVLNLCTNAWHALPPRGGRILVTLDACTVTPARAAIHPDLRPGPAVRLAVSDDGAGMAASVLEHIFEPFFTTKAPGSGTGLGLAVVHGIVKSHEGTILVQSAPGAGSTFELFFPAVAEAAPPAPKPLAAVPRGRGQRILLVDDDTVSGFAIEKLIESLGYIVTRHTRPEDALAVFTADPACCDLLVSDLAMPGMNGDELIERMLQVRASLPVVIVTGFVESARQELLEKTAARVVLRKPLVREEIARALADHVPGGS